MVPSFYEKEEPRGAIIKCLVIVWGIMALQWALWSQGTGIHVLVRGTTNVQRLVEYKMPQQYVASVAELNTATHLCDSTPEILTSNKWKINAVNDGHRKILNAVLYFGTICMTKNTVLKRSVYWFKVSFQIIRNAGLYEYIEVLIQYMPIVNVYAYTYINTDRRMNISKCKCAHSLRQQD